MLLHLPVWLCPLPHFPPDRQPDHTDFLTDFHRSNWRQWSQEEVNQYNNHRQKIHQYETAEEARKRIEKVKAAREKKAKLEQEYDDSLEFDELLEIEEEIKRAESLLEALRQSLED